MNSPIAAWRLAGWRQTLKPFKLFTITWLLTIPGFRCRTSTSTHGIFTSNLSRRRTGADTWWECATTRRMPLVYSRNSSFSVKSTQILWRVRYASLQVARQEKVFKCWQVIDKTVLPPYVGVQSLTFIFTKNINDKLRNRTKIEFSHKSTQDVYDTCLFSSRRKQKLKTLLMLLRRFVSNSSDVEVVVLETLL